MSGIWCQAPLRVNTGKLGETKATALDLADRSVVFTKNTDTDSDKENDAMTIALTPALIPADSNSKVTWTIDSAVAADSTKTLTAGTDYKIDNTTTYGSAAAKLIVNAEGTYKVTAKIGRIEKTATITVLANFNDVCPGAYYAAAVSRLMQRA